MKGVSRPPPVDIGSNLFTAPPPLHVASGEARAVSDGRSVTVTASATGGAKAHATGTTGSSAHNIAPGVSTSTETATAPTQDSALSDGHSPAAQFRVNARAAQVQAENRSQSPPPINPDGTLNKFTTPRPDNEYSLAASRDETSRPTGCLLPS